jgi:hypothetical protein
MGADKCIQVGKFVHLASDFFIISSVVLDWFEIPAIYEIGLRISVRKFKEAIVPVFDIGAVDIVIVRVGMPLPVMVDYIHREAIGRLETDFLVGPLDMGKRRIKVILDRIAKEADVFHDVPDGRHRYTGFPVPGGLDFKDALVVQEGEILLLARGVTVHFQGMLGTGIGLENIVSN